MTTIAEQASSSSDLKQAQQITPENKNLEIIHDGIDKWFLGRISLRESGRITDYARTTMNEQDVETALHMQHTAARLSPDAQQTLAGIAVQLEVKQNDLRIVDAKIASTLSRVLRTSDPFDIPGELATYDGEHARLYADTGRLGLAFTNTLNPPEINHLLEFDQVA